MVQCCLQFLERAMGPVKKKLGTQDRLFNPHPGILFLLCSAQIETHDHLFFECPLSKKVWSKVQRKGNFQVPLLPWEDLVSWLSFRWKGNSFSMKVKKLSLAVLVYSLWKERNCRYHNNSTRRPEEILISVIEEIRFKLSTYRRVEDNVGNRSCQQRWNLPDVIFSSS